MTKEEAKEQRRLSVLRNMAKYLRTKKGQDTLKKYRSTEAGKEACRRSVKKYRSSPEGMAKTKIATQLAYEKKRRKEIARCEIRLASCRAYLQRIEDERNSGK